LDPTAQQLTRGQQAVFQAREDYYGGKPAIDTVVFKEVPTSASRVQLLQGGAVDIAQYLQPSRSSASGTFPASPSRRFRRRS
jgi:peptide/nickel transport system substrate-binding protein